MIVLFVCILLFLILIKIPVVREITIVVVFVSIILFVGGVFVKYNNIVEEREAMASTQKYRR